MIIKTTIQQLEKTWLVKPANKEFETAAEALSFVKLEAKTIVSAIPGGIAVTIITWEPLNKIGARIIRALAS